MLTKVEQERMRYEARMLAIRTQQALVEVEERRIETGQYIGRIHRCEHLLNRPQTPSDDAVELTLEEVGRRADELEAELTSGGRSGADP